MGSKLPAEGAAALDGGCGRVNLWASAKGGETNQNGAERRWLHACCAAIAQRAWTGTSRLQSLLIRVLSNRTSLIWLAPSDMEGHIN